MPPKRAARRGRTKSRASSSCSSSREEEGRPALPNLPPPEDDVQEPEQDTDHSTSSKEGQGKVKKGKIGPVPLYPWTDEDENNIVEWWEQHPCLYNDKLPEFRDRDKRHKLLSDQAAAIGPECTAEILSKHMSSLRTRLNHCMKPKASGSGVAPGPRTDKDKFVWDKLSFIKPFIVHRQTKSSTKFRDLSSDEDVPIKLSSDEGGDLDSSQSLSQSLSQTPKSTPSRSTSKASSRSKRARSAQEDERQEELSMLRHLTGSLSPDLERKQARSTTPAEQETDAFLTHLRTQLLRLPDDRRNDLQEDILLMLHKARRESSKPQTDTQPQMPAVQAPVPQPPPAPASWTAQPYTAPQMPSQYPPAQQTYMASTWQTTSPIKFPTPAPPVWQQGYQPPYFHYPPGVPSPSLSAFGMPSPMAADTPVPSPQVTTGQTVVPPALLARPSTPCGGLSGQPPTPRTVEKLHEETDFAHMMPSLGVIRPAPRRPVTSAEGRAPDSEDEASDKV